MVRQTLYSFLLMFVLQFFTAWWSLAPAALIITFIKSQKASQAFGVGFISAFILWGSWALMKDVGNGGILSERVAALLGSASLGPLLFLISGLIAALVGGLAGLTGYYLQQQTGNGLPPSAHYQQ
jgi:hypothetical protein